MIGRSARSPLVLKVALLAALLGLAGVGAGALAYALDKRALLQPRTLPERLAWSPGGAAPAAVLLIGDSRIARWPLPTAAGAPSAKAGWAGEAAVNIARVAPAALSAARPGVVVVQAGYNDATAAAFLSHDTADQAATRAADAVLAIADAALAAGAAQVVVMTVAPANHPEAWRRLLLGGRQDAAVTAINARLRAEAPARGLLLLDADRLLRGANGELDRMMRTDASHWSPAAYVRLDAALAELLSRCNGGMEP